MKLTEIQQKLVEDNHKLIYWIISIYKLDVEEFYDILAIELCNTIMKYDESKGSLSNYFKSRCTNVLLKEYNKTKLRKNTNNGVCSIDLRYDIADTFSVEDKVELESMFDGENGNILRLKADGYTQQEIADIVGVTQSYVSKIIRKERQKYER